MSNYSKEALSNVNLERQCLASLLEMPDLYWDIDGLTQEDDFQIMEHRCCFILIREARMKKESINSVILAGRLIGMGISKFQGELPVHDYIDSLKYTKFADIKSGKLGFQELSKLRILGNMYNSAEEIKNHIIKNTNDDLTNIITSSDEMYNKISNISLAGKSEPIDLYDNFDKYINGLGAEKHQEGVHCPYPIFRDLYGDFYPKSLNFIVARAKVGKSSILENICWSSVTNPKQKVKALILDTEMDQQMQRNRRLSNVSGVNEWFIRTGKFKQNPKMVEAIHNAGKLLNKYAGLISYMPIGSVDISYVASVIRRWVRKNHATQYDRDNTQLLIVYDYIKLSGELSNQSYSRLKDYQIISHKVETLKQLANSLDIPILTAGQTNRTNEERVDKSKKIRNGSVVALSDSINQLSDKVLILDRLTTEEMADMNAIYKISPSHSLQSLYCRSLGRFGAEREMVKVLDDQKKNFSYYENRIFYKVNNFNMQELDSLWDLEQKRQSKIDITITNPADDDDLHI